MTSLTLLLSRISILPVATDTSSTPSVVELTPERVTRRTPVPGVGRYQFGVRRYQFGVRRYQFGVRRYQFGVRRYQFGVRRYQFGVKRYQFEVVSKPFAIP